MPEPQAQSQNDLRRLYGVASQIFNVGDFDTFRSKISDPARRRKFYDSIQATGKVNLGDFDFFSNKVDAGLAEGQLPITGKPGRIASVEDLLAGKNRPEVVEADKHNITPSPEIAEMQNPWPGDGLSNAQQMDNLLKRLPIPQSVVGKQFPRKADEESITPIDRSTIGSLKRSAAGITNLIGSLPAGFESLNSAYKRAVYADFAKRTGRPEKEVQAAIEQEIDRRRKSALEPAYAAEELAKKYIGAQPGWPQSLETLRSNPLEIASQAMIENIPQSALFAGATAIDPALGLSLMYAAEAGETSKAFADLEKSGVKINPIYRDYATVAKGALNSALEKTGVDKILEKAGPGAKGVLLKLLGTGGTEGGTEWLQEVNGVLAETGAQLSAEDGLSLKRVFDVTINELIKNNPRLEQAAISGAFGGIGTGAGVEGVRNLAEKFPVAPPAVKKDQAERSQAAKPAQPEVSPQTPPATQPVTPKKKAPVTISLADESEVEPPAVESAPVISDEQKETVAKTVFGKPFAELAQPQKNLISKKIAEAAAKDEEARVSAAVKNLFAPKEEKKAEKVASQTKKQPEPALEATAAPQEVVPAVAAPTKQEKAAPTSTPATQPEPASSPAQQKVPADVVPEEKPREFSSTQTPLPKDVSNKVITAAEKVIAPEDVHPVKGLEKEPHITVKFGLHTNNANKVKRLLADETPIRAKIEGIEIFKPKDEDYDVVVAGVSSDDLTRLNKKIADSVKNTETQTSYKPHITLGYVKKGAGDKYANAKTGLEGQTVTLDTIDFSGKDRRITPIKLGGTAKPAAEPPTPPIERVSQSVPAPEQAKPEIASPVAGNEAAQAEKQATPTTQPGIEPIGKPEKTPVAETKEVETRKPPTAKDFDEAQALFDKALLEHAESTKQNQRGEISKGQKVTYKGKEYTVAGKTENGLLQLKAGNTPVFAVSPNKVDFTLRGGAEFISGQQQAARKALESANVHPAIIDELTEPRRTPRPTEEGETATTRKGRIESAIDPPTELKAKVDAIADAGKAFADAEASLEQAKKDIIGEIKKRGGEVTVNTSNGALTISLNAGKAKLSLADTIALGKLHKEAMEAGAYSLATVGRGFEIAATPESIAKAEPLTGTFAQQAKEFIQRNQSAKNAGKAFDTAKKAAKSDLVDSYLNERSAGREPRAFKGMASDGTPVEVLIRRARSAVEPDIAAGGRDFPAEIEQTKAEAETRTKKGKPFLSTRAASEKKVEQAKSKGSYVAESSSPYIVGRIDGKNSPTFYSQLYTTLDLKLPNSGTVEQMQQAINAFQKKGEFKKDEIEWLGLNEWLAEQKGKIAKQQILDFVRDNQVGITEIEKGGKQQVEWKQRGDTFKPTINDRSVSGFYIQGYTNNEFVGYSPGYNRTFDSLDDAKEHILGRLAWEDKIGKTKTKFAQYVLPGGENYRELLLTLPAKPLGQIPEFDLVKEGDNYFLKKNDGAIDRSRRWNIRFWDSQEQIISSLRKEFVENRRENFKSTHFDEPNILAHIRFNERTDADGKRVLFVEEIQSDWHQAGRKKGYEGQFRGITELPEGYTVEEKKQGENTKYRVLDPQGEVLTAFSFSRESAINAAINEINDTARGTTETPVPNAPFKTSWHELAFKRVLRYAVDNGFERVAWTTGEQQAARYDLRKQVSQIGYKKNDDGTYNLYAVMPSNDERNLGTHSESKIEDVVGKDVAKKIVAGEKDSSYYGVNYLSGENLAVGGEGMKGFYDKILPEFVNKYTKKWGGRVDKSDIIVDTRSKPRFRVEFVTQGEWAVRDQQNDDDAQSGITSRADAEKIADNLNRENKSFGFKTENAHSLNITPAMREAVSRGQALFERQEKYEPNYDKRPDASAKTDQLAQEAVESISLNRRHGRVLLANAISAEAREKGTVSLIGKEVRTSDDVAALAQVYRDPRWETLRYIFAKDGKVVFVTGVSSRLPSSTAAYPLVDSEQGRQWLRDLMVNTDADGYWIVHNHPSGDVTPSKADIEMTSSLYSRVSGFKGHVIIDSNKYSTLSAEPSGSKPFGVYFKNRKFGDAPITSFNTHAEADAFIKRKTGESDKYEISGTTKNVITAQETKVDFGKEKLLVPSKPHPIIGLPLFDAGQIARLGQRYKAPGGWVTLISQANGVRGIMEVRESEIENPFKAPAVLRRFGRQTGASSIFLVGDQKFVDKYKNRLSAAIKQGFLTDAISTRGYSVREELSDAGKLPKDADRKEFGISERRGREVRDGGNVLQKAAQKAKNGENPQIYTPEFKKWFGDWENDSANASKVVDKDGKPLVVYHGTKESGFDKFDFSKSRPRRRVYFATNPEHASDYATDKFHPARETKSAGVYPVFLNIRNPLDLDAYTKNNPKYDKIGRSVESWQQHGYDGAFSNETDGDVWIAFEPTQIKSAIGNRGTFSPTEPSIVRESESGYSAKKQPYEMTRDELIKNQIAYNERKIEEAKAKLVEISKAAPRIEGNLTRRKDQGDLRTASAFTQKFSATDKLYSDEIRRRTEAIRMAATDEGKAKMYDFHRKEVEKALREGKPVPEKVLAEYRNPEKEARLKRLLPPDNTSTQSNGAFWEKKVKSRNPFIKEPLGGFTETDRVPSRQLDEARTKKIEKAKAAGKYFGDDITKTSLPEARHDSNVGSSDKAGLMTEQEASQKYNMHECE